MKLLRKGYWTEHRMPYIVQALENRILFINDDVIIVNKLAGEAMEGARGNIRDLPALLAEQFGVGKTGTGNVFAPVAVHRLDVPVTGCALFAGNAEATAFLAVAFARTAYQKGRPEKYYWAVVELSPAFSKLPGKGELVHWIETNPQKNKSTAYNEPGARRKEAVLRYHVLGTGKTCGFLEIELLTGRHHQIRAQFAALGIHIRGDLKYGARRSEKNGGIRLHARSLCFPDPSVPEKTIRVQADPPLWDPLWKEFPAF